MSRSGMVRGWWFPILIVVFFLSMTFLPVDALYAVYKGRISSGPWSTSTSWSPEGVPDYGNEVYIHGYTVGYDLTDSTVSYLFIRDDAILNHASGDLYVNNNLIIGYTTSAASTYNLGGPPGTLLSTNDTYVAQQGYGIFNQSGGTHETGTLFIAGDESSYVSDSTGTYNLNAGTLDVGTTYVGRNGIGIFNQGMIPAIGDGGVHNVGGDLYIGVYSGTESSPNNYNLYGGELYVESNTYLGSGRDPEKDAGGFGVFNQSGGQHTVGRDLIIGSHALGTGIYNLSQLDDTNPASLEVWGSTILGDSGTGTFTQSGGQHTVDYDLILGSEAGSTGVYNLSQPDNTNPAILEVWDSTVVGNSGTGTFYQSGGQHTIDGNLILGSDASGTGTYNLSQPDDTNPAILAVSGWTVLGDYGTGTFNQSGGTHTVDPSGTTYVGWGGNSTYNLSGGSHAFGERLILGGDPGVTGTYNLTGTGTLEGGVTIVGEYGIGVFNQEGGTHTTGTLTTAANPGSSGTYNLEGGTLTVTNEIVNNGTFNYSGGTLTPTTLTNNGTFKVTESTATFTGTLVNNGAYISDPSHNYFENLLVGPDGYLQGGAGDEFHISGDFLNNSTNSLWDTRNAALFFTGLGSQNFFTGPGGTLEWGDLSLEDGTTLILSGGAILSVDDIAGISLGQIVGQGTIIYESLFGNGIPGQLDVTSPVPIPSTVILFASGLLGLVGLGRRRLKA